MTVIQAAPLAPLRKARLLLRLGRTLNPQLESLNAAKAQISRTEDLKSAVAILRMASKTSSLRDDLRDAAMTALCDGR
jgi:hypothetical protein